MSPIPSAVITPPHPWTRTTKMQLYIGQYEHNKWRGARISVALLTSTDIEYRVHELGASYAWFWLYHQLLYFLQVQQISCRFHIISGQVSPVIRLTIKLHIARDFLKFFFSKLASPLFNCIRSPTAYFLWHSWPRTRCKRLSNHKPGAHLRQCHNSEITVRRPRTVRTLWTVRTTWNCLIRYSSLMYWRYDCTSLRRRVELLKETSSSRTSGVLGLEASPGYGPVGPHPDVHLVARRSNGLTWHRAAAESRNLTRVEINFVVQLLGE